MVTEAMNNGSSIDDLLPILCYMDEDDVSALAFKTVESGGDIRAVAERLACYMDEDSISELIFKAIDNGYDLDELSSIVCQLSSKT